MRVYIAGPMRGYPEFNFPTFDAVARAVRAQGWAYVNPADHDRDAALEVKGVIDITMVPGYPEGDLAVYEHTLGQVYDLLTWDTARIAEDCDGIVMLPGWEQSTGARYERFVAESLNKDVWLAAKHGRSMVFADGEPTGEYVDNWVLVLDPQQKRMNLTVLEPVH